MSLYRKYRPTNFTDIIGQDSVVSLIKQQVTGDKLSHAYLLTGPRGTGKTTTARILAKAINCLNWNGDVCNECESCLSIDAQSAIDVIEIDAASNRGIDEIRKIRDGANFAPTSLKKKVYIIDEIHMLSRDAFNSLLKTLEEPPQHVVFILATTEVHKVPATILSRVQRFEFHLATLDMLSNKFAKIANQEGLTIDNSSIQLIYELAGGSFRDAESLLSKLIATPNQVIDKVLVMESFGITGDESFRMLLELILANNSKEVLALWDKLTLEGKDPIRIFYGLAEYIQQSIHNSADNSANDFLLRVLDEVILAIHQSRSVNDVAKYLRLKLLLITRPYTYVGQFNRTENTVGVVPVKSIEEGKEKDNKLSVATSEVSNYDYQVMLDTLRSSNPKLFLVLSNSKIIELTDISFRIGVYTKFNFELMSKESFKQMLLKIAKNIWPGIKVKTVSIVMYEETPVSKDNSIVSDVQVVQQNTEPSIDAAVEVDILMDDLPVSKLNDNLVESIL